MSHEELRENLSAMLDGELGEAERRELDAHLCACEACRRELDGLKKASAEFKEKGRKEAPAGLGEAILKKAEDEQTVRLHPVIVLALVVIVLLIAGKMFKPQISGVFNQIMGMISGAAQSVGGPQ